MTDNTFLQQLSKSEIMVFEYIKEQTKEGHNLKSSMKKIGEQLNVSEATVHRAIRKLRKNAIIGIVPSQEKAKSNEIIFYGLPDSEKEADEIFDMVSSLNYRVSRFKALIEKKDLQIEQLSSQLEMLQEENEKLRSRVEDSDQSLSITGSFLDGKEIVSIADLGNGTVAYITKQ